MIMSCSSAYASSSISEGKRSTSGRGYHIIVRGKIPSGVHRDNVEMYSSGRYMICTGDVVRNTPIMEYQQLLDILYGEMKPPEVAELVGGFFEFFVTVIVAVSVAVL